MKCVVVQSFCVEHGRKCKVVTNGPVYGTFIFIINLKRVYKINKKTILSGLILIHCFPSVAGKFPRFQRILK